MIVFWVGVGAGLLAGWVCGWAVTSWWRDRYAPLGFGQEDDEDELRAEADEEMSYFDGPSPLPPERSREELGFTGPIDHFLREPGYLEAERERRAPWWEAEHRAAYESLGFDYPSGLMTKLTERLSA